MNKLLLSIVLTLGLQACKPGPESPIGFSLPKGDTVEGEKVFMKYQCLACHNIEGFAYDMVNKEFEPPVLFIIMQNTYQYLSKSNTIEPYF